MHVIAKMISYICNSYNCNYYYFRLQIFAFVHIINKAKNFFRVFLFNAAFFMTQKNGELINQNGKMVGL